MQAYHLIPDLAAEVTVPPDGILSRTLYNDGKVRLVLFGFAAGQELTEHTAKSPAIMHVLQGEVRFRLGEDWVEARAGTWVHMTPQLQHAVVARTPVIMLLLLLPGLAPA